MRRSQAPSQIYAAKHGETSASGRTKRKSYTESSDDEDDENGIQPLDAREVGRFRVETAQEVLDRCEKILKAPFKPPFKREGPVMPHTKTLGIRRGAARSIFLDPDDEGAVVLFRTYTGFDKDGKKMSNVIVDPCISGFARGTPRDQINSNADRAGSFLRPHQIEGVQFIFDCVTGIRNGQEYLGCILADEMGLGKTFMTITVIWTLLRQGLYCQPTVKKVIIITPASLVKNWDKEIVRWLGSSRIRPIALAEANREKVLASIKDFQTNALSPILIVSYETFRLHAEVLQGKECHLLICDEAHRLKNSEALVTQTITGLNAKRTVLLSGTPIQNNLEEFFNMAELCVKGMLGSVSDFRKRFVNPIVTGQDSVASKEEQARGAAASKELATIVSKFVLRRTNTILQKYLPPKVEQVVFCRPSRLQLALYEKFINSKLIKKAVEEADSGEGGGGATGVSRQALLVITELKKLCAHPSLVYDKCFGIEKDKDKYGGASKKKEKPLDNGFAGCESLFPPGFRPTDYVPEYSGKLKVLEEMLLAIQASGSGDAVVLISNYTQTLDLFELMARARKFTYLRLDGTVTTAQRQKLVDRFNDRENNIFLFLLSSKAGGCGLNIVGANRLVLFDPDWNPATDAQAMGRVWRDGQKKKCWIYRFLATGTIEEKIYQRQVTKQTISGMVIDEKENVDRNFSLDDMKALFTLFTDTPSDTHDRLPCKCPMTQRKRRILKEMEENGELPDPREPPKPPPPPSEEELENEGEGDIVRAPRPPPEAAPLQRRLRGAQKLNSMEEIAKWRHWGAPAKCKDDVLKGISNDLVTFIFQNGA